MAKKQITIFHSPRVVWLIAAVLTLGGLLGVSAIQNAASKGKASAYVSAPSLSEAESCVFQEAKEANPRPELFIGCGIFE